MKKIFEYKKIAVRTCENRGHLIGSRMKKRFAKSQQGKVIEMMTGTCVHCQMTVTIISDPVNHIPSIVGEAYEKNCRYGEVVVEKNEPTQVSQILDKRKEKEEKLVESYEHKFGI